MRSLERYVVSSQRTSQASAEIAARRFVSTDRKPSWSLSSKTHGGLTWGFDLQGQGLPLSDTTTNLAVYPPAHNGSGLNPSPVDALEQNTAGFVDFLDGNGTWVGTGTTPPSSAVYIRRWSIQPLPTNPNNTLVIQVLVTPIALEATRVQTAYTRTRMVGDALLVTVRTRKAS